MSYLPCENPSCKSFGKPHPNCRCYGGMAEGGEVGAFCSAERAHEPACEYFEKHAPHHHHIGYLAHGGFVGLHDIAHEHYKARSEKGHKLIGKHIDSVFKGEKIEAHDVSKKRQIVDDFIEKGGVNRQLQDSHYADGGPVKDDIHTPLAQALPDHNSLLATAKGTASNYLQSLKPQPNTPRLAFDAEPDQRPQQRSYKKALDLAAHPLGIMKEIQDGTVEPEQIQHLQGMYPELADHLKQKVTEKIVQEQLDGKKPSFKTRQGLGLLLGTPLSSELLPQNIQAAQAVFARMAQQQAQSPQTGKKPSAAKLSKSDQSFMTSNQALTARSQRQK